MERSEILKKLWAEQDEAFELMTEYDSLPHHYGEDVLYQAEDILFTKSAISRVSQQRKLQKNRKKQQVPAVSL